MKSLRLRKGFTLIELLVVIAILGVLAAVVLVAINPLQKIQQANDAKVKSDIGQIAQAAVAYATIHNGAYPAAVGDLQTAGELTVTPTAPTGYLGYTLSATPGGCTTAAGTCTNVAIVGELKRPVILANTRWCFRSANGASVEGVAGTAACLP